MTALYTAVGRYERRTDLRGNRRPVVIVDGHEYTVSLREMVVWTLLCWRILKPNEIISQYDKKISESGLPTGVKAGVILERLMSLGIITRGIGETGEDALYDLLSGLFVVPVRNSFFARLFTFLKLTVLDGYSVSAAKTVFRRYSLSKDEKRVADVARQAQLSTSEIIRCVGLGVFDVSSDEKIMDSLYGVDETTSDNLIFSAKYHESSRPVLTAVSNLYLRKQILFESRGYKM